jgi:hypothetical protein
MSILSPGVEPSPPNKAFAARDDQGEVRSLFFLVFFPVYFFTLSCILYSSFFPVY